MTSGRTLAFIEAQHGQAGVILGSVGERLREVRHRVRQEERHR